MFLLVGGFNPSENMLVKLEIFPMFQGENRTYLKPPPSLSLPPPKKKSFGVDSEMFKNEFPRKHHGYHNLSDLPRNACDARPLFCVLRADAGSEVLADLQVMKVLT